MDVLLKKAGYSLMSIDNIDTPPSTVSNMVANFMEINIVHICFDKEVFFIRAKVLGVER